MPRHGQKDFIRGLRYCFGCEGWFPFDEWKEEHSGHHGVKIDAE